MNNYILNSGSCSYNGITYNYIETNNHYACPYVFKTSDNVAQKYVYFRSMPTYGSGSGTMGFKDSSGNEQMGVASVTYDVKALGIATISEAAEIGGVTSDSSLLIIKNSLSEYNCLLKDTPTVEYTDNRCVNYIDIEKIEPDIFNYHIYLNHNSGFITENSNNLIYEKAQESGWDHDEKPQNYNDSIRTDINLTVEGALTRDIGYIIKPLAPASEGRYYTYDTFTNIYYSYTLYSNNTCTYEWGFNSDREGQQGGTTENITCFVGNIVPPTGEDFAGNAIYSTKVALLFEKEYTNATINGKTIKLCLIIN